MIESPNIQLTKMLFNYVKEREKKTKVYHDVNSNIQKRIPEKSEDLKIPEEMKLKE